MIVETERLFLREMRGEDYDSLYAVLGDAEIMRHYPYAFDEKRVRDWIERNRKRYQEHGFGLWAVCLKETGEMIGDCGLTLQNIQGEMLPEIGYHIRRDCQRKGYAREAAAAVRDWAFEHTAYPALYSYCKYTNTPSIRTAEAVGMAFFTEYPDEINGVTHVSRITREAWEERKRSEANRMKESVREDYEKLVAHWNRVFVPAGGEETEGETDGDAWKGLAPSEKLFHAAQSLRKCKNVLDYGSGSGWAGIILAKSGCPSVTCADPAPNARLLAEACAKMFHVENVLHPVCVPDTWLSEVPDETYDGFFCSNVLDVIPPEMAEDILKNAARILTPGGRAVISLNFYMQPEAAARRGVAFRDGNKLYMDGVLRLVNRTDTEWAGLIEKYFRIDRMEYFAWPGEEKEARRLFYLRAQNG